MPDADRSVRYSREGQYHESTYNIFFPASQRQDLRATAKGRLSTHYGPSRPAAIGSANDGTEASGRATPADASCAKGPYSPVDNLVE